MDLHHTLAEEGALVSTEARRARPVDIPKWPAEPEPQAKAGPRGRTCTCTFEGLSFVPLPWATRGGLAELKLVERRLVPKAGFAPTLCAF